MSAELRSTDEDEDDNDEFLADDWGRLSSLRPFLANFVIVELVVASVTLVVATPLSGNVTC